MASFPEHFLVRAATVAVLTASCALIGSGAGKPRFLKDDPLLRESAPRAVPDTQERSVDPIYDFAFHTFATPDKVALEIAQGRLIPSADVNTIGEVPDGNWYTNRHWLRTMSREELVRGPGNSTPPAPGKWRVVSAKSDGVTPGFTIADSKGNRYLLKLDPPDYPELASGPDVIGSKLFYALGYETPENYIVKFREDQLELDPAAKFRDANGKAKRLTRSRVHRMLLGQTKDKQRQFRALASKLLAGKPVGPFKYTSMRSDDPNDVVRHENRRVLRGLAVFCAWTNHTDSRSQNSLDMLVSKNGTSYIQHYLIDFGSTLGSDSIFIKEASRGNEFDIDTKVIRKQILTLGFVVPEWSRTHVPKLRGIGNFSSQAFYPKTWKSAYPNPAFMRMETADAFWAARQVARFSDDDLRALAATAEYTDPRATDYMAKTLIERRDKIVAAWINGSLPFDRYEVDGNRLTFQPIPHVTPVPDSAVQASWAVFDNQSGERSPLTGEGLTVPASSAPYLVVRLKTREISHWTDVFLQRTPESSWKVVGVERNFTP